MARWISGEKAEELLEKGHETLELRLYKGKLQTQRPGEKWKTYAIVRGYRVHKFEAAGLGRAPFRVLRMEVRTYQACPGAPVQVGGSCDYCGTGIKETYIIQDADGKEFKVGNQCVYKTADEGLIKVVETETRKAAREKRAARQEARELEAVEALTEDAVRAALAGQPDPNGRAGTLLDYCDFIIENRSRYGTTGAVAAILKAKEQA
jgi:hypothetical protein